MPQTGDDEHRLPHGHRVPIAPQRVDLAVVRQQPERLGQRPARQRVGRVALVEDRDRALVLRIAEVGEEGGELGPGEQGFVDDGAAGEGAGVEAGQVSLLRPALHLSSREVQRPLPRLLVAPRARDGPPAPAGSPGTTRGPSGPSAAGLVGTSRQPRNGMPSSASTRLDQRHGLAERLRARAGGRTRRPRTAARAAGAGPAGRRRDRTAGAESG